jgi:dienelactone hydrolase
VPPLDFLLQHPDFAPAIDAERIGAVGESAGGHTVLAALGGMDPAAKIPVGTDSRIKAAFGVVPFMGGSVGFWPFKMDLWFFGEDHAGLQPVKRPFMALYAEKDSNVPPEGVEAGLRAMTGPATGIMLDGEKHIVSDPANSDIRTWEILFFNAWLRDDAMARRKITAGTSVSGGVTDHRTISQPGTAPR